ncbi:MAG: hypothetical protein JNJ57_01295 [Saprospiraceae bacterium]|nr:hypothetical protein [Saprospiraceae bacterium]
MKKIPLFLILFSLNQITLHSQVRFGINLGYNTPWAQTSMTDGNIIIYSNGVRDIEVFDFSFGKGYEYGAFLTFGGNDGLQFNMKFSFLDGTVNTQSLIFENNQGVNLVKYESQMLWINPSIKFQLNSKRKFRPFINIGPSVGLLGKISRKEDFQSNNGQFETKIVYSSSMPIAITSGLGIEYHPPKNANFFITLNLQNTSGSYYPTRGEVTSYVIDGTDLLNTLTESQRKIFYKRKYTVNPNVPTDQNKPKLAQRVPYPFSSFGFSLGIGYKF